MVPSLLAACSDTGGDAPAGKGSTVRFWTIPGGPSHEQTLRDQIDAFMQANPDVTVEPQFFAPEAYGQALQTALGGPDAPDVFRVGGGVSLFQQSEKIRPIQEFLTDEFTSRFPSYVYDGANPEIYRDGEAYTVPYADPYKDPRVLLCNMGVLNEFGFDAPPTTWSQFREMAAKITKDGNGQVYGTTYILQTSLWFQALAGPQPILYNEPPISLLTGKPAMSEPSLVDTVELWQGLAADGVLAPGWEVAKPAEFIPLMAGGQVGMYAAWPHFPAQVQEANPDLELLVAPLPEPDTGRKGSLQAATPLQWWYMNADVREPEAAWKLMEFLGSVDFQRAGLEKQGHRVILEEAYEGVELDPITTQLIEVGEDTMRLHPNYRRNHPQAGTFYADLNANGPTPIPNERYAEAVSGGDYSALAADYDQKLAGLIEEMLSDAKYEGLTMDAFTFPDWNPLEDYTA